MCFLVCLHDICGKISNADSERSRQNFPESSCKAVGVTARVHLAPRNMVGLRREGPSSLPFHGAQPTSAAEVWVPSEHPQLVPSARRLVSLVSKARHGGSRHGHVGPGQSGSSGGLGGLELPIRSWANVGNLSGASRN